MHRFPKCYAMTHLSQSTRTLLQYFIASIIVKGQYSIKIAQFRDISQLICWRWYWASFIDWNKMQYKIAVEYFRKCGQMQTWSIIICYYCNETQSKNFLQHSSPSVLFCADHLCQRAWNYAENRHWSRVPLWVVPGGLATRSTCVSSRSNTRVRRSSVALEIINHPFICFHMLCQ